MPVKSHCNLDRGGPALYGNFLRALAQRFTGTMLTGNLISVCDLLREGGTGLARSRFGSRLSNAFLKIFRQEPLDLMSEMDDNACIHLKVLNYRLNLGIQGFSISTSATRTWTSLSPKQHLGPRDIQLSLSGATSHSHLLIRSC